MHEVYGLRLDQPFQNRQTTCTTSEPPCTACLLRNDLALRLSWSQTMQQIGYDLRCTHYRTQPKPTLTQLNSNMRVAAVLLPAFVAGPVSIGGRQQCIPTKGRHASSASRCLIRRDLRTQRTCWWGWLQGPAKAKLDEAVKSQCRAIASLLTTSSLLACKPFKTTAASYPPPGAYEPS